MLDMSWPRLAGHASAQGSDDAWDSGDHYFMVGETMTPSSLVPRGFPVAWVSDSLLVWWLSSSSPNNCLRNVCDIFQL